MTAAVAAGSGLHGRTVIAPRAVRRVVSAVTADALDVDASAVSVELADERGVLVVTARTPIRLSPLGVAPRGGERSGTLLERVASAQSSIRDRLLALTGSSIGRVDLRITGADLRERRRVA
ncbi:hypothetical protein ITJ64_04555 [Herbiconiux sp. VKM Ac-1786]|uniref:hypothetical protein n=1 Tax=Herbiconiux sp. VKM Ac-1786 TaxID=2783824 RepID=UPI00188B27AC|nr:hypothetical protein [Herbiconiux sp. VKM Ac-1786]